MASNIAELERKLLALTKRRIEIDSQWIAMSEQLLAAKASSIGAQDQEVPRVSEGSQSNSILPATQIANIRTHTPDAREEVPGNIELVPDIEIVPEVARKEVEVSADAAVSQDVEQSSLSVQSEVPKEESVSNASMHLDNTSDVQVDKPNTAKSPETNLPPDTAHQEIRQQALVPYNGQQIPPPPTAVPTNTLTNAQPSTTSDTPHDRVLPDTVIAQRPEHYLQQPATGIDLGNKQLLRTQRSDLHYPQPSTDMQNLYSNTDMPQNMMSSNENMNQNIHHPDFSQHTSLLPHSLQQMDPRTHLGWQLRQGQYLQNAFPSSPQVKAEMIQHFPYLGYENVATPQDQTSYQTQFQQLPQSQQQTFSPRLRTAQPLLRQFQHQSQVGFTRQHTNASTRSIPTQSDAQPRHTAVPQRRRRSPSLQITDVRPAQRPRLGDRPFGIDAASYPQRIKLEESTDSGHDESTAPGRFDPGHTPTLNKSRLSEVDELDSDPQSSRRRRDVNRRSGNTPSTRERPNSRRTHEQPPQHHQSHVPVSPRAKSRRTIDEDYDEEDEEEDVDDEVDVVDIRPRRRKLRQEDFADLAEDGNEESPLIAGLATRTTFGAPKPIQRTPLTLEQKHNLELRYCARVAMIIGSKRCVVAPVEQISKTKNIFDIMKDKFGEAIEGDGSPKSNIKLYRNATDFVVDVRGMLQCYVALGHCTPCPFRNPRVMCWRMRLESVLDQKMRGLKTCLKNCAENFDSDDLEGMMDYVDTWFNDEELQEDVDLY